MTGSKLAAVIASFSCQKCHLEPEPPISWHNWWLNVKYFLILKYPVQRLTRVFNLKSVSNHFEPDGDINCLIILRNETVCEYRLESLTLKVMIVKYCHKVSLSLACHLKYVQWIFWWDSMECYLPYVSSLWMGRNKPLLIIYKCLSLKLTWSPESWETLSQFRGADMQTPNLPPVAELL